MPAEPVGSPQTHRAVGLEGSTGLIAAGTGPPFEIDRFPAGHLRPARARNEPPPCDEWPGGTRGMEDIFVTPGR
jgi:hypothetical protein